MGWAFEYALNNSGFTPDQLAALNSGITKAGVTKYDGYETSKQAQLSEEQLAAVNSGINSTKVAQIDNNKTAIENLSVSKTYLTVPTSYGDKPSGWEDLQADSDSNEERVLFRIPFNKIPLATGMVPKVKVFSYEGPSSNYTLDETQGGIEIKKDEIIVTCGAGYEKGYIWAIRVWKS